MAFVLAGCGGESAEEKVAKRQVQVEYLANAVRAYEQEQAEAAAQMAAEAARAQAVAAKAKCTQHIGPLITALEDINSRLGIGLSFNAYSEKVGDLQVAYDRITVPALEPTCLNAAVAAEAARNHYAAAYNAWNDCVSDVDCDNDSVTPELQDRWAKASPSVERASSRLRDVGRVSAPPPLENKIGEWTTDIPRAEADVDDTIYGAAAAAFCQSDVPAKAADSCLELKEVLVGGVTEDETDRLDDAVIELNNAYGFARLRLSLRRANAAAEVLSARR